MTAVVGTGGDRLDTVRRLAPVVAERAAEVEAAGRIPSDLLAELVAAGCFRVLVPASLGGDGADLVAGLRLFEELARADGSVGWTVMIGASSWCDLSGLPRATFDALFAGGPDVIAGGAFNPSGSAVPAAGGYRINGRWAFVSGCEHCHWLFGNCIEMTDDGPRMRMAVFAPGEVEIEDTWHVSGLRGTGSHHITARDVFLPEDRTFLTLAEERCIDAPIVRIPPPALFSLEIASVAVGIAAGAVDDVLALAGEKVPLLAGAALVHNPHFQFELANADTAVRAARALVHDAAREVWTAAAAGAEWTTADEGRIRAAAAWATARAVDAVDAVYRQGGGSALYADSPLQRRLRDVHAVTQHFLVKPDVMTAAGAALTGQEVGVPVF